MLTEGQSPRMPHIHAFFQVKLVLVIIQCHMQAALESVCYLYHVLPPNLINSEGRRLHFSSI
jgi:hypothetical protein